MNKRICIEINGVFYESLRITGRDLGHDKATIKNRCLSEKFPNYKIVPFRVIYTEKKCIKCNIPKPLREFRVNPKCRDGHRNDCKSCESLSLKKYRKENNVG